MRYIRLLFAVIVSSAFMTGCSGSDENTSAGASAAQPSPSTAQRSSASISDPCRLLTLAEASAAVGETLERNDVQHYGPVTRCRYFNAGGDEPIWLDVEDADTFEGLAHLPDVKPVSGLGDRALWQHNELATFVHILKGGNTASMGLPRTLSTMTPAVNKAAQLVARRM